MYSECYANGLGKSLNILSCLLRTGMFEVNPTNGSITTANRTLRGLAGEYSMVIGVIDGGELNQLTGNATVAISVLQTNNLAPIWINPPVANHSVAVPEVSVVCTISDVIIVCVTVRQVA